MAAVERRPDAVWGCGLRLCFPLVYMYTQILVAMGIQWGHGLSECLLVVSDKLEHQSTVKNKLTSPSSIIILRCSMTFGQGIIREWEGRGTAA